MYRLLGTVCFHHNLINIHAYKQHGEPLSSVLVVAMVVLFRLEEGEGVNVVSAKHYQEEYVVIAN